MSITRMKASIWETCGAQREAEVARKERVAERVRALARTLGATLSLNETAWALTCPHCGVTTFISEKGHAFAYAGSAGKCSSTREIAHLVRDILDEPPL